MSGSEVPGRPPGGSAVWAAEDTIEAQRRTQPLFDPGPPAGSSGTPRWVVATVAVVAVLALLGSVGLGLAQWRMAAEAQADRDALAAEVAELRAEVAALRSEVGGGPPTAEGGTPSLDPERLLEDLFGGLLDGGRDGEPGILERLEEWFSGQGADG
ncbi:MAG: hypothetical protein ACLFV0_07515 [Nitriliruptoraceae bacterium]